MRAGHQGEASSVRHYNICVSWNFRNNLYSLFQDTLLECHWFLELHTLIWKGTHEILGLTVKILHKHKTHDTKWKQCYNLFSVCNKNSYIYEERLEHSWFGCRKLAIMHCMLNRKIIQMGIAVKSAATIFKELK